MRTTIARLGLATLLATGGLAAATPVHAAGCSGSDGVTVVVQHGSSTTTGCADDDPTDAGEALESAGFTVEKVQSDPRMLCTIDGAPSTSCATAPEAETFWGFFTATEGGAWTFADKGIFEYDPEPGSTLGFRFGDGSEPTMSPDEALAAEGDSAQESPSAGDSEQDSGDSATDDEESGPGALLATAGGVALLALLAGGAVLVARRRRH